VSAATVGRPPGSLLLSGRVSGARLAKDRLFDVFMAACALLAMIPLVLIVGYVLVRGWGALSVNFFTKEPAGSFDPTAGGIVQAFVGSGLIVGMATLFAVPLGLLTAIYLSEYGRGRAGGVIRFVAEVLLSTPSIIAGAFIWALVVTLMHSFSAFAGALALTFLMWPIIARATEEIFKLVPDDLREAALALGLPRWKTILRVVLPTAGSGILTAVMLALARGLGETAPILLTALGNDFINVDPTKPTDAVPLRIFNYARTPIEGFHAIAWGGAITLLFVVLALSISARILSHRRQRRQA
jgi:phosphate transport system permease protein